MPVSVSANEGVGFEIPLEKLSEEEFFMKPGISFKALVIGLGLGLMLWLGVIYAIVMLV